MSEARFGALEGQHVSQKAFQGSETKTRQLLEGIQENNILLGSLIFTKSKPKKIILVAIPDLLLSLLYVQALPPVNFLLTI